MAGVLLLPTSPWPSGIETNTGICGRELIELIEGLLELVTLPCQDFFSQDAWPTGIPLLYAMHHLH